MTDLGSEGPDSSSTAPISGAQIDAPPARLARAVNLEVDIATTKPGNADIVFQHSVLCQLGLPRRPSELRIFERTSGSAALRIEAGALFLKGRWLEQPLPWGALPRILLMHVSRWAIRHRTRSIPIGVSASAFLRELGAGLDGRRHKRLRETFAALFTATFRLSKASGVQIQGTVAHAASIQAWLVPDGQAMAAWLKEIELSTDFYNDLIESGVPLDLRAVSLLRQSSLGLDLYTWLAHRLHRLERPTIVRWCALRQQLGQEFRVPQEFSRDVLRLLPNVQAAYPTAKVSRHVRGGGGLILQPSPPPIPHSRRRRG